MNSYISSLQNFAKRSVFTRVVLYSLLSSITAYIHSSYMIASGLTQSEINSVYIAMSICGILGLWLLSAKKRSISSYVQISTILSIGLVLCLYIINSAIDARVLVPAIFFLLSIEPALLFIYDELLENITKNSVTSTTRSLFLTFQNTAWIIAPLIGFLLVEQNSNLSTAYHAGLIISVVLLGFNIYSSQYNRNELVNKVVENKKFNFHIVPALYSHFALQIFYSAMVAIMPIYMHEVLGWSWSYVGITIACALCAFPLVQLPLGKYLQHSALEKTLMPLSLILIGTSLLLFTSLPQYIVVIIPIFAYFSTRVGSATLELSNESYIFRHIDYTHRSSIRVFRSLAPFAYLFVPLFWYIISETSMKTFLNYIGYFAIISSIIVILLFVIRNYIKDKKIYY